mmetsp:Transcript_17660/g.29844  ORF Transcript_17660/g.29844 Transcript_17660/m.29844 type:complete len:123 (-) Transcript_17660:48-416(-)
MGYFEAFFSKYKSRLEDKTQGDFHYFNFFTNSKQKVKRKALYYFGLLLAIIVIFKALPSIVANVLSGGGGSGRRGKHEHDFEKLEMEMRNLKLELENVRIKMELEQHKKEGAEKKAERRGEN